MSGKRSSRSSASAAKKPDDVKPGSETKVFLIKNSLVGEADLEIINLTHPRIQPTPAKFLIHEKQLYEITSFQEKFRSWLIGQSLAANGNVYMTTSIDPLFLVLPFLVRECSDKAVPMEQLFVDSEKAKDGRILEVLQDEQLELVADVKRSGDIVALKYNKYKTLSWLERKCEKLVPALMEQKIHCGTAATSANFVKSEKLETEKESKEDVLKFAYFIVADYLSEELGQQLQKKLGIELKTEQPVSAAKPNATASLKRLISDEDDDPVDEKPLAKKVAAEPKVSTKSKALAKAASGSKSISSFFKKA